VNDIVQVYLDLTSKTMAFGLNGEHLGIAFEDFDIGEGLYPGFSIDSENECEFNFGTTEFIWSHEGFQPLYEAFQN